MTQLYELLHGESTYTGNLKARSRWWGRIFARFSAMRSTRLEEEKEIGEVEHSGCEFARMHRMLFEAKYDLALPAIAEIFEKNSERESSSPPKKKKKH